MNRAWLCILSVGLLLPLRWLPNAMSKPAGFMLPVVATAVMVTCGELVLNNPTVSPAGPYCPGDMIDITFTGSNLPDGEDLEVFIGDNSGYNPFSGGGTSIGTIPIGYNCSTCPSLLGLTVNVCLNDDENEFMLIHSGCGFDVSDLFVDLLPVGLSANDLGSVNGCPFMQPSASVMSALQSNTDCSNLNVIAAGDGDAIPAAALVIVFMTDTGPFIDYDISYLCGTGLPIYVIQNSCDLGIAGAFSNSSCPRTYSIDIAGSCYDAITYQCPIQDPPGGGHSFIDENGAWYTSSNCDDPPFSSLNYPDISNDLASLSYTIPSNICGANNGLIDFYLSGMVDIPGPCEDLIYTPPSGASISVACPATIDPAGPFCVNNDPVTLTVDEPGGTWSGTGIIDANNGIFDPGVAGTGTHVISYDAGCPGGPSTINITVNDAPVINPFFITSATTCAGDSSGQIVNSSWVTGGTMPYTYDWDAQSTPGNDVYTDDGNMFLPHSLSNVPAGWYDFIVIDAAGCVDTVSVEVTEGDPVTAVLEIDSIECYGESTGAIDIVSSDGPPVPPVYNWDDLSTPGDDDFGGDPAVDDDMEDISGLPAGTYAITITYEDPGFFECVFIDTIVIVEPPELIVTAPDSLIDCFGGTVDITAVATGGTGTYTYNWSNIGGSNNPATNANIGVGSYIVTVTDENGCTASDVSTITQPPLLTASATGETIDCDDNTGDITLVIMGGTGPFLFDWDNDGTGDNDDPQNLSGLNSGTYSVTVTDANGCTAVASAMIDLNPTTFMMPPDDGSTVPCILDAQTVPTPPVVLNSCNDPLTITGPAVSVDPVCSGTKTYTYTYTDPFTGIMATWVYTYTVSPPTFTLPANGSSTVACILDAQTVPTPPPTNDDCGQPLTITGPAVSGDPMCSGTKTYTWDYTDCSGTSAQWVYTYTISPPTFSMPAAGGSTVACVIDAQTVPTPPVVNNSCGDALTMTGPVIGPDPTCSGDKTYTWTYTDCTGTSADWVYTYTVDPSTFSLPADGGSTVACIIDAQVQPTPPPVNNSCGDPLTITGPVIGPDPVCSGTKTYTWDYENCDGTSSPWVYTYTISPPTFSLPPNGASTVACISDAQTVPTPPTVNNSCGDPITPTGPVIGADPVCSGDKTYTWTYTDCTGTSADWVYTYTVSPPTFSLPPNDGSTVPCIGDAQTVPTPPTVNNSCGDPITPTGPVIGPDPVCDGDKTYTWTYTDCTGTSADWVYTYTVQPTTFTLPADGSSTVACISDAQTVPTPPTVINSCGDPVVPTGPVVGPDPVCSGDKIYTWTYTDCDGNDFPWVYTYTVDPPTFTMPAAGGSTVACVADAQTVPTPPTVNNSCGDPLSVSGPVVGPDPVCTGDKTYTWTYTDCTGTSADWVYTYTVDPPTFTLPGGGSSTVPCVSDAQTVPTPPVVNNSCGDALTITGPVVGPDPVCSGTKTYTWDYTDCTGTSGQWVYTYTIDPSTFTLPADGSSTVACISDAQTVPTPPVVTNSCGDPLTVTGPVVGPDPVCSGTKTYTWDYENCDGSTLPWVYTYTINPPTFSVPADGSSTVACISDAQTVPTPPVVTNSCGDPITPTGPVVGPDPVCSGDKTYTWTYTDCTGTSADWVYTYTVDPPTFSLPANDGSTVPCIGDAQTVPTPPTVNNSCGDPITPTGPVVGPDPVCSGDKTYTWTYTDCTGTSADWVYTYTVQPTTFTLPPDDGSNVACISDAQTVPSPPAVINSCGDPVTPTGPVIGPDPVCSGDKTYTFTYTDCDGNDFPWVYTYTVDPPTFTLPADGSSTVACVSDAQTVPTPPAVNNSCGDPLTISGPVVGPDPVCTGDKTYTWTYTDCTGTSADWVYTYTVDPPTFTLPAAGGSTVPCVSDAQTVPTPPAVNNSCGDALTITGPVVGPDPVCSGTKTYTWDYTDCTGTSGQWVYTYTIDPSTFTLPADGSSTVACISDAQTVPTPPVVTNSCGDPLTVTGPVVGPDPVCSGTKTYTWDYENCDGSTLPWVYTYTIDPPTFTLPADGSSTVACISDAQTVPTPPVVNNSCGDPITPTGPVVGPDPVCSGDKTYTWTYTDCTGTSADWVYTYTVDPPTFTLPADDGSNVVCVSDAQTVPTPPTVNNSCGDAITPTGPVVGPDPVCSGDKTYTWTYTDCTGTSADWVYTYTVDPSTFTLPADDGSTVACISDAQVVPTPPAVINSCGDPVTPTGPVVGPDPVCSGDKIYTWTYTDCDGNDFPWVYTYTVDPPTFTLPAAGGSTVACVSDAQTVPTPPVVNNSCGDPLTISAPVVGPDPVCSGDKTYTWTYTDCTGTSADWVYTYTVDPPTFTLPANDGSTVPCVSDAQTVPTPPSVNNSCGDPLTISGPVVGVDPVCSGDKTYTWTFTDCTGTSADWVYTYTVDPSTFTLPADGSSTVACISDAQTVPTPPVVTNSCGDPLTVTGPVVGPDPVCLGTKTYTWDYENCDGSTLPWVYTYTIDPPTFTLPADGSSTVACISDAQTVPTPPTVNNSCGDPITPTGPVIGPDPVCTGDKTYTWTYTDCTGTSADWVYTYTVDPPTFTLPANDGSTVPCISDAQTVPTPPSVNNSCGDAITPTGPVIGPDPVCSGDKTYTWTYTDCTGTSADWVYTYTVDPSTFTLPADDGSTVACISDAQTVPTPPAVINSCGDPVTPTGPVVGPDPVCSGDKTYTWTYTDCDGNDFPWVYTYTVDPPTFTLPADDGSTVACVSDAQTVPTPPTVNNSCGDPLTISGPVVGPDPVCTGDKTYTWTYTDCTGTSADWVYTYTVDPPTFTLPANDGSTVPCVSDAQTVPTPPVVNNSCGDALTISGPVVGTDPVCSGDKTYTWTYTDCTGTSADWVYTYTVDPSTFTLPADGGSTVACISDAQVVPTPPVVTNSCGDPLTVSGPVVGPDPVCSGTKTYTWDYTNCDGSTLPWVYTYTIDPPTFTLPADDGSTVACISDAQTVPTPPSVNNSCGDPITPTGPVVGPDPVCSGDKTYTWTYTDCTGTSADWVYTYTVDPPTFTLPADDGSTVPCISDAQTVPTPPTVNNSCGDPIVPTGPVIGPDPVCAGDKTYTWTYTDCTGTSADWVYTYTIDPSTFTLPADDGSTVACISDAQTVPTPPAVINSCGDPVTPTGPVIGPDPVCSGDKTYTWTYTDCAGMDFLWVYTYTVDPPTFTLPADDGSTVACVSDAQTVPTPPVVNNSCGDPITPTGPVVGPDPVCSGDKTYTWTYTDCTGTSADWVYTYTVDPPTFTLPVDDGSTVACVSDAQTVPTPPVVNNSCGDPLTISGPVVGPDPVCSGDKTYTWTYTDCTGTSADWVYTYTVDPSTFTLPANDGSTVACISDAQTVPTPPVVNNSCGDPLTISGPVVGPDPVCSGDKTYTWTYTDCSGASSDWVYTYTVDPPTFTLPADDGSNVACISDAQAVPTPPVVNNSCGDPLTVSGPVIGPDPVCSGDKTYTWTYTDCTGASADWVYTYTVDPPTFTLPADDGSMVACNSDAQVEPIPPVVNNSCGDPLTVSGPVVGPDPVCSGDKTYTWTYTDCTGTSSDWVYTYTIDPSTFTLPADDGSNVACVSDAQTVPTPPAVINSCGDPVTPTGPVVGPDPVCSGDKTYTWTYTDCAGTDFFWVYTYTVDPPTFTLPADDGSNVACVSDAQVVPTPPAVDDSCGEPITPTGPVIGPDPVCSGDKTYTWTYTDCTGASADWVYTYTVDPPTFALPADDGSTVACVSDAQVQPVPPAVSNSCGDPLTISGPVVGPDPVCSGDKTYTWTYTDCTGASADWVYTYTVDPSTFTLPADGSSTVACISDAQVEPTPPVVTNSCGDPLTISGPVVGPDPVCSGDKTYTWDYTNCDGSTSQWVYTYTIDPPTFTLPADDGATVACISDAQAEPIPPVVNNSCGDPLTISGPVVGPDPVCSGDKTYTWTYTDCTGTSADWVYTYTVDLPTFTLPADDGSTVDCVSDAQVEPVPPAVNNSCGDPIAPTGPVIGVDPVCSGDKTYTWTYTDCDGTSADWVYTYTVLPTVFTLPPDDGSNVPCISDAQTEPTPPVVLNDCGDVVVPSGPVIGPDPVCSGDKTYTWTFTDCVGNSLPWVYTYTVDPPTFTLPADDGSTVACISDAQVEPVPPIVVNSCGDPITPTGPVIGADPVCTGDKTYTWTYTDCTGTSADWVYTYTVDPPTFSLPADDGSTVACVSDAQVEPVPPAANNSCGDPLTISGPTVSPDPVCSGTKTYTWDYTDCTGTSAQWVYTYTVDPSSFSLPPDDGSTVACISDAQVEPTPPVVTNSCGDPLTISGPVVGPDPVCSGDKTYTWDYTNCDGSSSSWVYTYTIDPPSFTLPADDGTTVACVSDAQVEPTPPVVNDSCGDPVMPTGPVVGPDPVCSGDKTYTWTYTDCTGATADWVYTYTVDPPTFTLPVDDGSTVPCIVDAQVEPVPPVVTNSCGDDIIPTGPVVSADPACSGDKTYTWTYTDCDGTSLDWTYTYTITGDTGPVFTAPPADITVACVADVPAMISLSYTNDCSPGGMVAGTDSPISGLCPATITRTWTFTDACGNVGTVTQDITIDDTTPPTASDPSSIIVAACNDPVPAPDISVVTDAADNCSTPVVAFESDVTDLMGCTETTTRTFTVTDACNNSITVTQLIIRTVDMDPPVFTDPPADLSVDCISQVPPMEDLDYTDNCSADGTVMGTETGPSGDPLTIVREWTVTDDCGNGATHTQTITITEVINETNLTPVLCVGDIYTLPDGNTTTMSGMYGPYLFTGSNGCDSTVNVDLTFITGTTGEELYNGCQGDGYSVVVNGNTYDEFTPTGMETIPGSNGCDSIVTIDLTFNMPTTGEELYTGCEGDGYSVVVNGNTYDELTPMGTETLTGANGCDSVVTIDLTFHPNTTGEELYAGCEGDGYSVVVNGTTYDELNPNGTETLLNANGCDSIVTIDLTFAPAGTGEELYTGCEGDGYSVVVNGTTYDEFNPNGVEMFPGSGGCDSTVTIDLIFNPIATGEELYTGCEGDGYSVVVNGNTYDEMTPMGTETLPGANGCDSVVTIDLTFHPNTTGEELYTGCQGDGYSVVVNGTTYDELNPNGTETFLNANGCDSTVTIDLTFAPAGTGEELYTGCEGDGYFVVVNGNTYDEFTPNGTETFPGSGGCDSTVTIDLDFFPMTTGEELYTGCEGDGYSVVVNGNTYDELTPMGTETLTGSNGCDSVVTIDLTFNANTTGEELYTGCEGDGYSVVVNGTTYDESNPTGTETISGAGCDSIVTIDLTFVPFVEAEISPAGPYCTSAGVMTLVAVPAGGTWSGDVNSDQFDPAALGTGSHQVIYTSPAGACQTADTIYVDVYELEISCEVLADESAPNAFDGRGQVTVTGGVPPYTISWSGPMSGSGVLNADGPFMITGLTGGVYTVEVEDATGCIATCEFTIMTPVPCDLMIDAPDIVDATCPGVNNGSILVNVTGTMPPFEYSLDGINFDPNNFFDQLAPGNYTIYVRDDAGCEETLDVVVGVGDGPELELVEVIDASCGLDNGSIEVTASGGTTPYMYSVDGVTYGLSDLFPGLAPGEYLVYLIDDAGCTDTIPVDINSTDSPVIDDIIIAGSSCGQSDGGITIIASGGLGVLMYSINGGGSFQASNVFTGLPAGNYPIVVQDEAGCQVTGNAMISDVGGPMIDNVVVDPAGCGLFNGVITVTASGVPTLMYSLNGGTLQSSNVFSNLLPGNYTLLVQDGNGCDITQQVTVTTTDGPVINSLTPTHTTCDEENGEIAISWSGGTGGIEIFVDGDSYGDQSPITDLPAGTYTVEVVDDNGCSASNTVTINPSEAPDFDVYITPANCGLANGVIELDGFDGTPPYTYSINNGPFSPTFTFVNRISDFYIMQIRDANGCIYEEEVFLWEAPGPEITNIITTNPPCGSTAGMIQVITDPATDIEYSINVPTYQDSNKFVNVAPGTYTVTIRDEFGCTDTGTATIEATPTPEVSAVVVDTECGSNTGSITASATMGLAPYTYALNNGPFGAGNVFSNLTAGTYVVKAMGANGCIDSLEVEIISVGTQYGALSDSMCEGEEYMIEGETFTQSGEYEVEIPGGASDGCDSILVLTLTVDPYVPKEIFETICEGEVYTYNGMDFSVTGTYDLDTLPAAVGCDTLLSLNLTVNPLEVTYLDETICYNGVFTINGMDYTDAGEYPIDTVPAAVGCDSIRILRLMVDPINESTIDSSICEGEVVTIGGMDYSSTGFYEIDTVAGPDGCDTIIYLDLEVNPLPTADAGADKMLDCAMQTVTLDGSGTGGSPLWTGPDIDATNETQFAPEVSVPGLYILTVTSGTNCVAVDSVVVDQDPDVVIANAGVDDSLSCDVTEITLQASPTGTNYIYQWTGPGIDGSNENLQNPTIDQAGTYTLIVTDTVTGCVSAPDQVIISDISVVLIAIIQDPNNLTCFIDTVNLSSIGSSTGPNIVYAWFDGEGELVSTTPGFEITSGGLFVLVVEDTISGCFGSDSVFVEDLTQYPVVDAGPPQVLDCNNSTVILNEGATNTNDNLIFEWVGPAGGIIGPDSLITALAGLPGEYFLIATDTVNSCQNLDSVMVIDMTTPPIADIDVLEPITCLDESALMDIGSSTTGADIIHSWSGPDLNNFMSTTLETTVPGEYYLDVINEATGCTARDTVVITPPDIPTAMAADVTIPNCAGDASGTITVTDVVGGTPPYMYSLNGGPLQSENVFEDLFSGNYTVQVVDANGCTISDSYFIEDGQEFTIDIGPDIFLELGDSVTLSADISLPLPLIDSLVWTPADILSCTLCPNPVLYGLYTSAVTATVYSGGCIDQDMLIVRVDVDADIYIPNVFSPNNDGINDKVTVYTDYRVRRVVYFEIFDRWGNQVFVGTDFQPNDPDLGWDGTFKGKEMNPAVFAYTAKVELLNGQTLQRKGDITLLR